jgi:hypothetical protein
MSSDGNNHGDDSNNSTYLQVLVLGPQSVQTDLQLHNLIMVMMVMIAMYES